jgi:hypothetical protein
MNRPIVQTVSAQLVYLNNLNCARTAGTIEPGIMPALLIIRKQGKKSTTVEHSVVEK